LNLLREYGFSRRNRGEIMFGIADMLNKTTSFSYDVSDDATYEMHNWIFYSFSMSILRK
jgi:hypothetical protein